MAWCGAMLRGSHPAGTAAKSAKIRAAVSPTMFPLSATKSLLRSRTPAEAELPLRSDAASFPAIVL